MNKTYDVLVIGDYSLDLIFTGLAGLPQLGGEMVGSGFEMLPGESYNCAVSLHRLGVKVGWAGDFGDDEFSRFAIQRSRDEGLDQSLFVFHQRPYRRISVAASFPEDRAFITYYDPEPRLPAALKALASVSARALYVPGFYAGPLLEVGLRLAHSRKMKVVMDGNSGRGVSLEDRAARNAVQGVDVLLPNAREARCLTGEMDLLAALRVLAKLCPLVVLKDGPRGSYVCEGSEIIHAPAIRVTPVDTTGAGDAFNAGFLKAWLDGLPLLDCLRWGNVVGGLSTLALGGTTRVVKPAEVHQWLKKDTGS
ncbi:MAG TPA: PfkB family carbohydrate kinase [Anaerolineales bacterium]